MSIHIYMASIHKYSVGGFFIASVAIAAASSSGLITRLPQEVITISQCLVLSYVPVSSSNLFDAFASVPKG